MTSYGEAELKYDSVALYFCYLIYFQAQYEFYEKYTLGILNNDINTVLKGSFNSENVPASDNAEKEDSKKDDIDSKIKEDEKNKLSDSNILQYRIPRFNESKILGKNMVSDSNFFQHQNIYNNYHLF